jgi:hypothetical protein
MLSDAVSALREGRWDDYEALVRELLDGGNEDQIWEGIAAAHPAELNLIDTISSWPKERARSGCYRLLPAIGKLPAFELVDVLRLLEFSSHLEPSYRHMPAENLRPHIAKRPALGTEIGEHLRTVWTADEASQRVWAGAFTSAAPKEAADYAIELLTGAGSDSQLLALLVLFLPTESPAVQTALTAREKEIADLLYSSAPQLGQMAWAALTCITEVSPSAMGHLLAALDAGEQQAAIAMSNALYRVKTPSVGVTGEPLEWIVQRLLAIGLQNEQVRAHVDQGIESLLFRDSLRPHAVSCLHGLCTAEGKVAELFGKTFGGLSEKSRDFACVLTAWLLRPDASFQAIGSLLSRCTAQKAPVGLDTTAFVAASSERRVKAARRLLALTHHGPTLCQFIAFLAEMTALGPERLELASQMLNEAFAEYPGATEDFLREKTRAFPRSDPVAPVYRDVYANVLRWRRVLARLPALKELRPTDSELHALRSMKRRMNRDILRGAAEQSVFANLFTSVHVAQGRRFASHTRFGPPQIVEMGQASHSIELPSSELADPMRGLLQRLTLLKGAR